MKLSQLSAVILIAWALIGCQAIPAQIGVSSSAEAEGPADLSRVIAQDPRVSAFAAAIAQVDAKALLPGSGAYTLFVPLDDAIAALPEGAWAALVADEALLDVVLRHHIVAGVVSEVGLLDVATLESLSGDDLPVDIAFLIRPETCCGFDQELVVGEATVLWTDIEASNGVIHLVDAFVWLPEGIGG